MRVTVPITGELLPDGSGNQDNPVRPVDIRRILPPNARNFGFDVVSYYYDQRVAQLDIYFEKASITTRVDEHGDPIEFRQETDAEFNSRVGETEAELAKIRGKGIDEIRNLTGEPELTRLT